MRLWEALMTIGSAPQRQSVQPTHFPNSYLDHSAYHPVQTRNIVLLVQPKEQA